MQSLETAHRTMSYAETLDNMIRESYRGNLEELSELWETMGLSQDEIEQRMNTVRTKVSDITTEMVECDRENKLKIEEACIILKKSVRVMWRKLKKSGEPEPVKNGSTLLVQQKTLKMTLESLEKERNEIMGHFR